MEAFDRDIRNLKTFIESKTHLGQIVTVSTSTGVKDRSVSFKNEGNYSIVLKGDTHVELGPPRTFSMAPVLVTERPDLITDGQITTIGPDLKDMDGSIPFAQILLIQSTHLKDEDYRHLNSYQYELNLKGYMIKALPSSLSIWSRVSNENIKNGFTFEILGKELLDHYRSKFNVESAEVIFITSSESDILELKSLNEKVVKIISAMNRMIDEASCDCSSCEFVDVCSEVEELSELREKLMEESTQEV